MQRGTETIIPNWALDAEESLTLMTDAKVFKRLVRFRQYRDNTYSTLQLAYTLTLDPRTIRASLERLHAKGLVLSHDGQHCSPEAASKLPPSQVKANALAAQAVCKPAASPLQKDSASNPENDVLDASDSSLNKGIKEEKNTSYLATELDLAGEAGEQAERTEAQTNPAEAGSQLGANAPAAHAASQDLPTPSQVQKDDLAGQKTEMSQVGSDRPPPAASRSDDTEALQFFNSLAGYGFCMNYRLHLARWFEQYSADFLRLALQSARRMTGVRIASVGFVWLLNGEKEWPEELKAQYERDYQAAQQPNGDTGPRVRKGDLLRWADGHTATVERLDRAFIVTDSENDERGYVAFAALGKGVEVLRS